MSADNWMCYRGPLALVTRDEMARLVNEHAPKALRDGPAEEVTALQYSYGENVGRLAAVRCGTVIEGKRPTREQNDGVERVMGFWNRVVSSEQVAAIGLPYADSITFRGLTYTADGSDDPGTLWHAIDAQGYPLDLGVE